MTHGQLPDAFGYEIHQESGVGDDFRRFLKKLAGHTVRLSATRLDADGTGRRNDGKESRFVKRFYFTRNAIFSAVSAVFAAFTDSSRSATFFGPMIGKGKRQKAKGQAYRPRTLWVNASLHRCRNVTRSKVE